MQLLMQGQVLRGRMARPRALHLSPLLAEISKPRVKEEEELVSGNTPPTSISMDTGAKVIGEHCHGNTMEEKKEPEGEEWTEMKLSWRELPKMYLELSKSRLTC